MRRNVGVGLRALCLFAILAAGTFMIVPPKGGSSPYVSALSEVTVKEAHAGECNNHFCTSAPNGFCWPEDGLHCNATPSGCDPSEICE